jgi:hypothetical protein
LRRIAPRGKRLARYWPSPDGRFLNEAERGFQ